MVNMGSDAELNESSIDLLLHDNSDTKHRPNA